MHAAIALARRLVQPGARMMPMRKKEKPLDKSGFFYSLAARRRESVNAVQIAQLARA